MEGRLQEKQIPIGLLSKQVVLEVEEAYRMKGIKKRNPEIGFLGEG